MAATIRDVAHEVGVSASTVSRAFSRPDLVDAETRTKVLEAAARMRYRPNKAAQILNTGRTGCMGAVLPDLENPFFAGILKGAEKEADRLGYQMLVADTSEDVESELRAVRALAGRVDGLLLCSPRLDDEVLLQLAEEVRVVLVNRTVGRLAHVNLDNEGGVRLALRHLAGLGHRQVGYVGGELISRSARRRLETFEQECEQMGLQICPVGAFPPTFEGGGTAADSVLGSGATGVVVYNDVMAIGLMNRLLALGVRMPERLSVVGIDNVPVSAMVTPALTTVDLPRLEAGRLATELLHRLVSQPDTQPAEPQLLLPTSLVVRSSTAALAR